MDLLKKYRGMYATNSVMAGCAEETIRHHMDRDQRAEALVSLDAALSAGALAGIDIRTAEILITLLNETL